MEQEYESVKSVATLAELIEVVPRSQNYRVRQTLYLKDSKASIPYVERGSIIGSQEMIELYGAFKSGRLVYVSVQSLCERR